MNRSWYEREKELFLAALAKEPSEREAFLQEACAGDSELRAGVAALLEADAGPEPDPPRIGRYQLVKKLGEGGMGEVWLARQDDEITRDVAVKLIRWGVGTERMVARFRWELQVHAEMSHANIARVHDAGVTPRGSPYFVMEYVPGIPITEYCDAHRLSIPQRLALFRKVCDGVEHAHRNGVAHRDLKPSNILVIEDDSEPVPKIIDFGIAKAIAPDSDRTALTERGQLVGTRNYMSPEQAEMGPLGIDTRTDVYSLGVVLYELLVGQPPFDFTELSQSEFLHTLREDSPQKPSSRVGRGLEKLPERARSRSARPKQLVRQLSRELDWIVLKALEKDRTRRYDGARDLAADIVRYLKGDPLEAGPPGAAYQVRKFVRRHAIGVAAAAAVILLLVVAIAGVSLGLVRAKRAERQALAEARTAQQVTDFLESIFEVSDPDASGGATINARDLLDEGAERIETELHSDPAIHAALLGTIGRVYRKLGLYDKSLPLLERAIEIHENLPRDDRLSDYHERRLFDGLTELASAYENHGQLAKAAILRQRIVTHLERYQHGSDDQRRRYANAVFGQGALYLLQGDLEKAETRCTQALGIFEELGTTDRAATAANTLGKLAALSGRPIQADAHFRRALAIWEAEGPERLVAMALNNLGMIHAQQGCLAEAEPYFQQSLKIRERVLGPEHPEIGGVHHSLGGLYYERGEYEKAGVHMRRALEIHEAAFSADNPRLAIDLRNLGELYLAQNQLLAAESSFERALQIWERSQHPYLAYGLNGLAKLRSRQGKYAEAERLFKEALHIMEDRFGSQHAYASEIARDYAAMLAEIGRDDEAEALTTRFEVISEQHEVERLSCAERQEGSGAS